MGPSREFPVLYAVGSSMTRERSVIKLRRRGLLAGLVAGLTTPLTSWAQWLLTPRQSLGPFYPVVPILDADNDLARVPGGDGFARGTLLDLAGTVSTAAGDPVAGARVEIWQCNAFGRYHHPRDQGNRPLDPNFQGHGHFITGPDGRYRFRTIRPVPYPGRTPHIHFRVVGDGIDELVTQMYVEGEPANERDMLLRRVTDPEQRRQLIVALGPAAGPDAELAGTFDIVVARIGAGNA